MKVAARAVDLGGQRSVERAVGDRRRVGAQHGVRGGRGRDLAAGVPVDGAGCDERMVMPAPARDPTPLTASNIAAPEDVEGIRSGLLFPRADGNAWHAHDWKNWCRRVWHTARAAAGIESLPPYDLRHAFASLQIRAGMSVPELAEQLGHAPAMTIGTSTHVIRELKGEPIVSAEEQIERARRDLPGRFGDVGPVAAAAREPEDPRCAGMARPGLEPGTPRFSVVPGGFAR